MAKSRARYLAELLNSSGRVKKDKSDLTGGDSEIDLDSLPTITNAKLQYSSIGVAGHTVSLGGSVSLNTGDISEHTDYKYYTDTRVRGAVSVSGDLSYNSTTGVISYSEPTMYSDSDARSAISVSGSLSYNSTTGVISYTTPTTIASLSNHDTDDLSEGASNLYFTNERVDDRVNALLSAGTGITLTYDDANNTLTIAGSAQYGDSDARSAISVSGSLSYNSTTGVISYTTPTTIASLSNHDTADLAEGTNLYYTDARADARITAALIDEDSFATNSATRLPSQQSVKAYVDAQVAGVVDSAPAALNTLNELAAALGDDANFSTTTSTALGNRLRVDTASQGLTGTQQANALTNLGITATKAELNYVDGVTSNIQTQLDGKQASGSYLTGNQTITLSGDASGSGTTSIVVTVADDSHNHIISNVDGLQTALDAKLPLSGGTLTGALQAQPWLFRSMSNQTEYHVLNNGSINGPSWKFRYDGATANRYVDFGYKDGNGNYTSGLKLYNNQTISWRGTDIINSSAQWIGGIASSGYNNSNWDTAYGWGNHASAGYSTFSGSYNDLTNKPTIPTNNNQLTNGAGYLTSSSTALDSRYYTETEVNSLLAGYISTSANQSNNIYIKGTSPTIYLRDTDHISSMIHQNSNLFYILRADAADDTGWTTYSSSTASSWPMVINLTNSSPSVAFGPETITANGYTMWHSGHFANNSSNWNTAYGWGNHASAGYITSVADRTPLDHIRSLGTTAFTGTATTAGFISEMESDGAFDSYSSVFKTSWSYAGNFDITDAGTYGPSETAGMSFLTWTDNSDDTARGNITLLAIAPNTGGSAGRTFIYNDQGSSYSPGWREIWTSRRMGSGTGLDADLLDGIDSGSFLRSDAADTASGVITFTGGHGAINITSSSILSSATSNWTGDPGAAGKIQYHSNRWYIVSDSSSNRIVQFRRNGTDVSYIANDGNFVGNVTGTASGNWSSSNDGSGSGLDADTLRGYIPSESAAANTIVKREGSGHIYGNYILGSYFNASSGNSENPTIGQIWTQSTGDNYLRKSTPAHFRNQMISNGLVGGTSGKGTTNIAFGSTANSDSGFYDVYNNGTPTGTWYSLLNMAHYGGNHGHQIAGSFYSHDLYHRYNNNGTLGSWSRIWSSLCDGSGSGLDADLLDGLHGSSYLRRDTSDTMTGQLNMHANSYEGSITFGSTAVWRCGIRQHDDADAELRIWARNANGMIFLATGYDGEPASISRPTDGLVVQGNKVGIGNFSSSDPGYKLQVSGTTYSSDTLYAYAFRGHSNVAGTGEASYHPAGIYSTSTNWLYGTMYRNGSDTYYSGGSVRSVSDIVSDQNYGYGVVGFYSASVYQHVWSMGASYRLAANGVSSGGGGSLYGLAWSYNPNYGYSGSNSQSKSGLNHQLLLMMNGTTHTALGTGIWTNGNVTAYSDRRVKTNIEVIPNALSKVEKLSGYTFDRTDVEEDPSTGETNHMRQTGVIAQEVLEVLPEAVMGSEKEGYSVAYGNMVGLLIEAIKEQQQTIKVLTERIEKMENK